MKLNSLTNERKYFVLCLTRSNAPWEIWNIRPVGSGAFFNDDQVAHLYLLLFLQPNFARVQRRLAALHNATPVTARCNAWLGDFLFILGTQARDQWDIGSPTLGH